MTTPLVTVITVTYNSSTYVADAIESILHSSYAHFELIVGDDCSTDTTWSIVQSYTDGRIRSYRNEQNLGEYPNRNKAIGMARGEYLIFIDGDDMVYPHGIEFMINNMVHHSSCGMALMHPYINWIFLPVIISSRDFYLSNYFHSGFNGIAFTNTLFRTIALKEVLAIYPHYRAGDVFIRLRIASRYPVLIIQDQLTWWRETPGQASYRISKDPLSIIENFEMHNQIIQMCGDVLSNKEKMDAYENELSRIKEVFISQLKRFKIKNLNLVIHYLLKNKILLRFIRAKRKAFNPFSEYNSSNPLSLKGKLS